MKEAAIILRAAEPTFDEGLVFARYLDEAAEGFFRLMLGRRVADILAKAFTAPDHDFSFQNVTFAEQDGVIVGMASGYTGEQHHRCSDRILRRAAGFRVIRMLSVGLLGAPLWRFLDTIRDGDFYLQAIAVDARFRGQGLGSRLIDSIEERAVAGGSKRLSLDVAGKNEGARRLYERRGMSVESRWPKRLKISQFKLFRMTKEL